MGGVQQFWLPMQTMSSHIICHRVWSGNRFRASRRDCSSVHEHRNFDVGRAAAEVVIEAEVKAEVKVEDKVAVEAEAKGL